MKSDTSTWLYKSHFSRYFHFSSKNDPFLVYPSVKNHSISNCAQGGGASSLKKIRGERASLQRETNATKTTIPL